MLGLLILEPPRPRQHSSSATSLLRAPTLPVLALCSYRSNKSETTQSPSTSTFSVQCERYGVLRDCRRNSSAGILEFGFAEISVCEMLGPTRPFPLVEQKSNLNVFRRALVYASEVVDRVV